VLKNRAGRMIENEYPLGFKIALQPQGSRHRSRARSQRRGAVAGDDAAAGYEDALIEEGHGDDDNSALARTIRRLSGLEG